MSSFYRYLVNPIIRTVLKSPCHGLVSGNIAIVHFKGRVSGRELSTPISFMQEGNTVRLLSSQNTNWWKNLRGGSIPVEMEIKGQHSSGIAHVMEGDSETMRDHLRKFLRAVPRDAIIYGLKLDRDKQLIEDGIDAKLANIVVVAITLQ